MSNTYQNRQSGQPVSAYKPEFFHKRQGTTNLGTDYENFNIANFAFNLATKKEIETFKMSSNDAEYGDFDDIVLQTTVGRFNEVIAFQLKHSNKEGILLVNQLEAESGDFSIKKYINSVKKIKANCDKFVLYTNLKFEPADTTRLQIHGKDFTVGVRKISLCDNFKTFSSTEFCYQFYVDDESSSLSNDVEVEEYRKFFKKFYLYANQNNVEKTKKSLYGNFKKFFGATEKDADSYIQFIADWAKLPKKKEKLNKTWIKFVILLQLLSSKMKPLHFDDVCFRSEEKIQVLKTAFTTFKFVYLKTESYENFKNMWSATKSEVRDLKDVRIMVNKYRLDQTVFNSLNDLENETLNKIFWLQGKCPLVIEANDDFIYNVIKLCPDQNYILLGDQLQIEKLPEKVKIFKNLSQVEAHTDLFGQLTKTFTCSIQGKDEISLDELCKELKTFPEMIESDDLVEMLNGPLNLGGEKEIFSFPYVPRYLLRHLVDINYLENIEDKTVVIIDNVKDIEGLRSKFSRHTFIKIGTQNDDSLSANINSKFLVYFSENECCTQDFEKLSQKKKKTEICHHLRWLNDNCLEWIRGKGDINQLQNHKLTNLVSHKYNFFDLISIFLSKSDIIQILNKLSLDRLKETILWSEKPQNNINLLVGEPGMGKSELMKSLKNQTLSNVWTIVIDPNDIFNFFETSKDHSSNGFLTFITTEKVKHLSLRDKQIFEMSAKQGNVIFVWDALDEIDTEKVGTVGDIILEFSKKSWSQWVTARSHLQRSLELKFNVLSRNLTQFDTEEQKEYIRDRLKSVISIDKLESIIEQMQTSVVLVEQNNILGVPLLLYMMTELIKNDSKLDLFSGGFLLNKLYHHFFEQKLEVFYTEKLGYSLTNHNSKLQFNKWKKKQMITHTKFALKLLFPKEILTQLNVECKVDSTDNLSIGLIVDNQSNISFFSHLSFAEYLVALYLSENVDKKDFFKSILFEEKYNNVRFFFDLLSAKNSPAHVAVLYRNLDSLKTCKDDIATCRDQHGRNLLHLVCSWGQRHPHFKVENVNGAYIVDHDYRFSSSAESPEYSEMLDFLLNKCNNREVDDLFGMTPLEYAQQTTSLVAEVKLRRIQGNNLSHLNSDYVSNILYYSAQFGYMEAFELFISDNTNLVDVRNIDNWTLLLIAIHNKHFDVGKHLLSSGAEVNVASTKDGFTPLFLAVLHGNNEIIKDLLRRGADIHQAMNNGASPLYLACEMGQNETVRLLLDNGADMHQTTNDGFFPLLIACQEGQNETVRLLLDYGAHINQATNDGASPLYIACQEGQNETVRLLLDNGADINQAKNDGVSPLYIACFKEQIETVRLLLDYGAHINQATNDGASPLYIACQEGQNETVRLLLDNGADINQAKNDGVSPLYIACFKEQIETVRLLLVNGAHINQAANYGASPLYIACQEGQNETVRLLLDNGADINQAANDGASPLYIACQEGQNETVRLLLDNGADINQAANDGASPLYIACQEGQNETVRLLLDNAADINQATNYGSSPLNIACQMGQNETVRLLLDNGADINQAANNGASPLYFACQKEQNEIVRLLLDNGADINQATNDGAFPLHIACLKGQNETVRLLLDYGADINQATNDGASPLYIACFKEQIETVRLLLVNGAHINQAANDGASPLHIACHKGQNETVRLLLDNGADINQAANDGASPLYIACQEGQNETVRLLLDNGADINQAANDGPSPLHIACHKGQKETVRLLLDNGADINQAKNDGASPLYIACFKEQIETVRLLLVNGAHINQAANDGASPLNIACQMGQNETVRLLLDNGADINQAANNGASPLYFACQKEQNEIVRLLLDNGADINQATNDGAFPLYIACEKGQIETVRLLLDNGANINQETRDGASPLFVACQKGQNEIVRLLLDNGADINQATNDGFFPLYIACEKGQNETVRLLLDNGADINQATNDGFSPLHVACLKGQIETARLLLDNGANINQATNIGASPLYIACHEGQNETVRLLLDNGADINQTNKNGVSPLNIARQEGQNEIVRILLDNGADVNQATNYGISPL